jgi:hypothetical protein
MKKILFSLLFSGLTTLINAHEKYEFMTMIYKGGSDIVALSIDGKEHKKHQIKGVEIEKAGQNSNGLLFMIKEYQEKNWELVDLKLLYPSNSGTEHYFAYLRRKISEKK